MVLLCRYLYALEGPPSPQALTAVRTALQALALMLVAAASTGSITGQSPQKAGRRDDTVSLPLLCASTGRPLERGFAEIGVLGCWALRQALAAFLHQQCERLIMQDEVIGSSAAGGKQEWWLRSWLTSSTSSVGAAGAELGLWNFLATSFQVRPCRPPSPP